jgi:O-antigen/teichoic acid export membrane protein
MNSEDSIEARSAELRSTSDGLGGAPVAALGLTRVVPRRLMRSPTFWQAGGFAGAGLLANGFAVVATALLTRTLTTAEFGSYAFAVSLLFFVAIFFEFGLFVPAARLVATMNAHGRREVVGAALVAFLPVGVGFSAIVIVLSFWIDDWFHVDAGYALRAAAAAAIAFPFVLVLQQLTQGLDRLHVASVATAGAQLLFVALLAPWVWLSGGLSTAGALVLRAVALLIAYIGGALWLKPAFGAVDRWGRELVRQAREWGFQVFVGRVLSIGTYNMDVLMLGIWANARWVGFYVLAGSLATASGLPVMGMAAALFARMAREPVIPRRWLSVATAVGAACAATVWLLAEPVISVFFSARYLPAVGLVLPLAVAQLVRGVTGIFNTFLSAHGRGRDLRNAGAVLTLSNVAFNFILIPPFGAQGAAWASLLALVANLIAHAAFYRRAFVPKPARSAEIT